MAKRALGNVWNITGNLLWAKLSFTDFDVEILNIDRCQFIIFNETRRDYNGVVHIVTTPRHKGDEQVFAKCDLAVVNRGAFNQNITFFNFLTTLHFAALIVTTIVVGFGKVSELILFFKIFVSNNHRIAICFLDFTSRFGKNNL